MVAHVCPHHPPPKEREEDKASKVRCVMVGLSMSRNQEAPPLNLEEPMKSLCLDEVFSQQTSDTSVSPPVRVLPGCQIRKNKLVLIPYPGIRAHLKEILAAGLQG